MLLKGETSDWEMVIGLEVHAQVVSKAKLFSGAATDFGAEPNSQVSFVDAAMPGMLPVINEFCVEQAVRTGLGLKAKINRRSVFDRKNYFYPDLPQGYQISQYKQPVVGEGEVLIDLPGGESAVVGIERLHLEQDAGKSLHDQHADYSYVDLNRSGVALMEIVSKPDLRSADEAMAFLAKMRSILRYLGTCDGDMEKGSLRADINVSVRRPGEPLGTRCEIKNVNSIRFVMQAIEFEARRQIEVIESGGKIVQEARSNPGSVPSIFSDHPPTPDRIIKAEKEIKTLLPQKSEYLVSTSEFSDMKTRLEGVMSMRKKMEKDEAGPTLRKRQPKTTTSPSTQPSGQQTPGDDKPPVLQRRD